MASGFGETMWEITRHSLDLAILAWPISLVVLSAALLALAIGSPFRDPLFRRRLPVVLLTYVFPVAVAIVGAVFRYDGPPHPSWVEPPPWYGIVLWAVIAVHGLVAISAPIFLKGVRARSTALVLPGVWLSLSAGFIAAIAIAGVGP
jgi:hypothetical protein